MFTASHSGILYDYEAKEMRPLQGHQNPVTSISSDIEGKWVATADEGKDSVVIVWDSVTCTPVNTAFSPHSDFGVARVAISPNSKYLVTVGMEHQPVIKFWLWTYGKDVPDDVFETTGSLGKLMSIDFNPDQNEHILVTFENEVIFLTWEHHVLKGHYPTTRAKVRGRFTDSTYMEESHVALTANSTGYVYVWSNSFFVRTFTEAPLDNNKDYNKAVRIELDAINCIVSIDGIVATGNSSGHIKFYDNQLRILYWCQNFNLESVIGISFHLTRINYKIKDALDFSDVLTTFLGEKGEDEDRSEKFGEIYKQLAPSDATLDRKTFIVRDFIATTATGRIVLINFLQNTCETIWNQAEAKITSIDIHETKPIIVIGNAAGRIVCYNYHSNQHLVSYELPDSNLMEEEDIDYPIAISCLKFSRCGIHLACGMQNGVLWFLDPTILETKIDKPYGFTAHKILKICFSTDSNYMAHYDAGKIVCLYYFNHDSMKWIFNGKMRSHYKPIRDMVFSKNNKPNTEYPKLFTIGEDRHLVEYDIGESSESELKISSNERIDQTAIPLGFVWYPTPSRGMEEYFLTADDQYKFKIINDTTGMCHRTMLGPTCEAPVCKMIILPSTQTKETRKYMIFATQKHIGLQIIPITGNPYTHIGMIGHPEEILQICISSDGRTLFTIGENDHCVLKWLINTRAVDVLHRLGGENLTPYYSKIEGGDSGWLFQEMKDLFYYMQILEQGENSPEPRKVSDRIPITRLSDLMRAIGFYPTDYELENIITDVKYRHYNETGCTEKDITFEEFVKTYVNHKPAFGVPLTKLKESFEIFEDEGSIDRETLLELLMEKGERMTTANIKNHLMVLFHHSDIKKMNEDLNLSDTEEDDEPREKQIDIVNEFNFIPEKITYKEFIDDILGIDMKKQNLFQPVQVVTEDSK